MGLTVLPDALLRRMDPAERAKLGKAGMTAEEGRAHAATCRERELHKLIFQDLRRRELFFIHSRMDKRSTNNKGLPDFIIILYGGAALAVEVKVEGGHVSAAQEKVADEYFKCTRTKVHVVWSFDEYHKVLQDHLPRA